MMFPGIWNGVWPAALVNHLWQSTLVALLAWLLTLALRNNRASTRYRIWMIASIKFLVPFLLLISAGESLRTAVSIPIQRPALAAIVEPIAQPTLQAYLPVAFDYSGEAPSIAARQTSLLPTVLLVVWFCGFLGIAFSWARSWWRIRTAVRGASPMNLSAGAPVLASPRLLEPGVFGIFRPLLLMPENIGECLSERQLSAIVAHEMCHIRRRDNLTAAIHMVVQALFWFHPAVWFIGARLLDERETACDEAVLQSGNEPELYAESILSVCKLYVESPIACMSGVTGSDLKRRIVRIMTGQAIHKLDFGRKLLLGVAALAVIAAPVIAGLGHVAPVHAQAAPANAPQDIADTWQGTLHTNRDVRFVIRIMKASDGTLSATFYNIDGDPGGIPVISTTLKGSLLKLDLPFGTYEGTVSADGNSITGTWTQGPNSLPLNFARATPETEWTIPQPPPRLPPMPSDADPKFEVSTIKPSKPDERGPRFHFEGRRFSVIHISLSQLVQFSYGLQQREIVAAPNWFSSEAYDIAAEPDGEGEPSIKQWQSMVKKLMADRFKLQFHYEKRELAVYALTVAKTGPKLIRSQGDPSALPGLGFGPGNFGATNATMADIAEAMQQGALDRPVVDQTGLTGRFDLRLAWTPDGPRPATESADAPPDVFTAIQEQLGLKLESTRAPVDVLVIDHVERPSEN
jgi:uncharacterized protein (TIGR03435 family)